MHEELDRIIGCNRMVMLKDKQNLHYCNAVIMEIQRMANVVIFNLPRRTNRDITINRCRIKKGSIVIPQCCVMMIDPKVFY
jgi:cytochrome P450